MFSKFWNPALIIKLPVALRVLKTARTCPRWGVRKNFFFMVSEQVNLNHERPPYGKIEKSTKSLHPTADAPVDLWDLLMFVYSRSYNSYS